MKRKQEVVENPRLFRAFRVVLRPVFWLLLHPKYYGRENIPGDGAVVFATNHKNFFADFLEAGATKRNVHFLAQHGLFEKPILGFLMRKFGLVAVDRENKAKNSAMHYSVEYLKRGHLVQVHPEGTRNRGEKRQDLLLPFKPGAVVMAKRAGAIIIPSVIVGNFNIFGKSVKMIIGEPLDVSKLSVDKGVELLRKTMYKMLKENGEKI
jgi:1-acyl-sn-glycerol-3-phosphate acyltransferase